MLTVFLIIFSALLLVGLLLKFLDSRTPEAEKKAPEPQPEVPEECCGQHEVCERESLLAAVSERIEYFDDEELDRFRGRSASDYSPEEAEEFRQVLLSTREDEVAAWSRSLQLRGIELPESVRDELILIVSELRQNP